MIDLSSLNRFFHQTHLRYLVMHPWAETNRLDNLFQALRELDPLEVRRMLPDPLVMLCLLSSELLEVGSTEEEQAALDLDRLEARCRELAPALIPEPFLVHALVSQWCSRLFVAGHSVDALQRLDADLRLAKIYQEEAGQGEITQEEADRMQARAQDAMNNLPVDIADAWGRYLLFVEQVVATLMPVQA